MLFRYAEFRTVPVDRPAESNSTIQSSRLSCGMRTTEQKGTRVGTFFPTPSALLRRAERQESDCPLKVYYNDNDPYCCRVLRKNIERGHLLEGYVDERDIRDVQAADLVGYQHIHLFAGIGGFPLGLQWAGFPRSVRTITGGFPCQPHSLAGKRKASTDERDLWEEFYRIICEFRPSWVLAENVPGLLSSENGRFFGRILKDLATGGYDAQWQTLPAFAFGAPHLRERTFIVAYSHQQRLPRFWTQKIQRVETFSWCQDIRSIEDLRNRSDLPPSLIRGNRHGIPDVVDRLRGLGNAVVPQVVEYIARCIMASQGMESEVD